MSRPLGSGAGTLGALASDSTAAATAPKAPGSSGRLEAAKHATKKSELGLSMHIFALAASSAAEVSPVHRWLPDAVGPEKLWTESARH